MIRSRKNSLGFTLAELLIALMILGEIATFTIPKILTTQQSQRYNAIVKEDIGALSDALQKLRYSGTLSSSTKWSDITSYLNYLSLDSSSGNDIDAQYSATTYTCDSSRACIKMHNGSIIMYRTSISFGGTATTNALHVHIDPDGVVTDGTTNGPGKSIGIYFYYNGRVTNGENIEPNTQNNSNTYNPTAGTTPPWFSW